MISELQLKVIEMTVLKSAPLICPAIDSPSTEPSITLSPILCSSRIAHLHQVATVAVAMLVQMCHFRLAIEQAGAMSSQSQSLQWLHHMVSKLGDLDMGLGGVVRVLLQGPVPSAVQAQTRVGSVWEQYALSHFNGRLVRGCCYLGCTNLDGASEAALKTQLCSGCMKARYCSVRCQKAAWCKGEHKSVCCR